VNAMHATIRNVNCAITWGQSIAGSARNKVVLSLVVQNQSYQPRLQSSLRSNPGRHLLVGFGLLQVPIDIPPVASVRCRIAG